MTRVPSDCAARRTSTGDSAGPARRDTRERILDAAVRLFGERGYAATSLRAVTEAAGANIAAVNYHFGSKEGLLRAVVSRAMAPVNTEREQRLDRLLADGGRPRARDVVRIFTETGASLTSGHEGQGEVARFLGRVMFEPEPAVRRVFADEVSPVEGRCLTALGAALPALAPDEVAFRYRTLVGLLALHQTGALDDLSSPAAKEPATAAERATAVERLVTMATALFDAP
ncbi:TetR family transcriptional regulator [Streptomyces sp. NPDC048057]|uniref:TetR family transcriptional regulator n=1 Tax=Streptomyces sp. NPDC048057 TaxID=3155628 RepID=UPI0033ECCCB4